MAFLKTTRARGGADILINLDHVQAIRPVSTSDRRARVVLAQYDGDVEGQEFNTNADFDHLWADWSEFDDGATVVHSPQV